MNAVKSGTLAGGINEFASRTLFTRCLVQILSQISAGNHFLREFQHLSTLEYSEENHSRKEQALRIYKRSVNKAHEDALAYSMVLFDTLGDSFDDVLSITSDLRFKSTGFCRESLPMDAINKLQTLIYRSSLNGAA